MGDLPEVYYTVGSSTPLEIVFEVANDTMVESAPIVFWQMNFGVSDSPMSAGSLAFESLSAPNGSLFGPDPGPLTFDGLPAGEIIASDADTSAEFAGVEVSAHTAIPMVAVGLSASSDANGTFTLWGAAFDSDDVDHSSYWIDAVDFEPTAFANPLAAGQRMELVTVHVIGQRELFGDYNGSGTVDAADYTVWRNGLGSSFTIADYGVWKQHFGESRFTGASSTSVPEPDSLWLLLVGMLIHAMRRSLGISTISSCSAS